MNWLPYSIRSSDQICTKPDQLQSCFCVPLNSYSPLKISQPPATLLQMTNSAIVLWYNSFVKQSYTSLGACSLSLKQYISVLSEEGSMQSNAYEAMAKTGHLLRLFHLKRRHKFWEGCNAQVSGKEPFVTVGSEQSVPRCPPSSVLAHQ